MAGICQGRVVIVTGAGRGIGRSHALAFARAGAKVVVNDIGAELDGTGSSSGPAGEVVDQIRARGGDAIANGDDVSDFDGAKRVVDSAIATFGDLHVVVNNAGILRDRMLANMTVDEWDAVIRVHLRGTFSMSHHAAMHWREQSRSGTAANARIINTTSPTGLYGNIGQANYGAAKAGIAMFSIIGAMELGRYGVTVNCISPGARTRMTETIIRRPSAANPSTGSGQAPSAGSEQAAPAVEEAFDVFDPENISPLVVWLGSEQSSDVNGQIFSVRGGHIGLIETMAIGPEVDKGSRWEPEELGLVVQDLVAKGRPRPGVDGHVPAAVG
jgi:NAD(P)-dependent dehydrogenase (short-subunit alcohol dehydrogenase family)